MHLSESTLSALPPSVAGPDRRPAGVGIVHLGLGAFHRAHQVAYTDDALLHAGPRRQAWASAREPEDAGRVVTDWRRRTASTR